jgi:hypothetical protein
MKFLGAFVFNLIAAVVTGCGGAGTVPAGGTITYKGQPVANAKVVFTPEAGGVIATGQTDAQGKFSLGVEKPGDGAAPGDYRVSLTPIEAPRAEGDYSASPPPPFPVEYTNSSGSSLKATVKAGDKNDFALELKDSSP